MRYVVSSCLMGCNCKYNGGNNANEELMAILKEEAVLCVCPEVLGGLPIPRACAELQNGRVKNMEGQDVTKQFYRGAQLAMQKVQEFQGDFAILQPRSPSCGKGLLYDGTFSKKLIPGHGIFAQMLLDQGIIVCTCDEFLEEERCRRENAGEKQ